MICDRQPYIPVETAKHLMSPIKDEMASPVIFSWAFNLHYVFLMCQVGALALSQPTPLPIPLFWKSLYDIIDAIIVHCDVMA